MSVEADFYRHLTILDSVDYIVTLGLDKEVLPTPELWPVYEYALEYYFKAGKTQAISEKALSTYEISAGRTLLDVLSDNDISLEEPDLPISDVVDKLKGTYIIREVGHIQRALATDINNAPVTKRLEVAQEASTTLIRLLTRLSPQRTLMDLRRGAEGVLQAYEARSTGDEKDSLYLGVPEIDRFTGGIRPGEVGVFLAFAKVGKSRFMARVALQEWKRGRRVALFSLENPMDMTRDSIACIACSVDSSKWDRGQADANEVALVKAWVEKMEASDNPLYILRPDKKGRTVEAMIRQAQALDVESVLIDQLSHIIHPEPRNKPRHEVVRDIMQSLTIEASTNDYVSILVNAQISRTGKSAADKRGWYELEDFGESSEIERSMFIAHSMYQSNDARQTGRALWQIVASRRTDIKWFDVEWKAGFGHLKVRSERTPFA